MVGKKIAVEITQATESIRRMRGTSEPHLMRCADGELYVVKFLNNPQHPRFLINELLCAQLARRLGLPVPPPTLVEVSPELIQHSQSLFMERGWKREPCASGLHFASRYPGPPQETLVADFLPDKFLRRVRNPEAFLGALVFDKWTCNCDGRQMVFYRHVKGRGSAYNVLMIDHGFCFNGGEWKFPDSPIRSVYQRRVVYDSVRGLESFEPFLSSVEELEETELQEFAANIPEEWYEGKRNDLDCLIENLFRRRRRVRQAILDTKNCELRPFPNWSLTGVLPM